MKTPFQIVLSQVAKALREIDAIGHNKDLSVVDEETILQIDKARAKLINVLFSNGYELKRSYHVTESTHQRQLIPLGIDKPLPEPIPEREAVEGKPIFFLFGDDACRIYSDEGIEALTEYIESGEGYALYEYTGDVFDLMGNYTGWNDYIILSKDEYDKISEL